jgi:hypothetical protein
VNSASNDRLRTYDSFSMGLRLGFGGSRTRHVTLGRGPATKTKLLQRFEEGALLAEQATAQLEAGDEGGAQRTIDRMELLREQNGSAKIGFRRGHSLE